jgi:hypothetical protein
MSVLMNLTCLLVVQGCEDVQFMGNLRQLSG